MHAALYVCPTHTHTHTCICICVARTRICLPVCLESATATLQWIQIIKSIIICYAKQQRCQRICRRPCRRTSEKKKKKGSTRGAQRPGLCIGTSISSTYVYLHRRILLVVAFGPRCRHFTRTAKFTQGRRLHMSLTCGNAHIYIHILA